MQSQISQVQPHHIALLDKGGCIAVVGGRTTNFPAEYRENPRLKFFDSNDPHSAKVAERLPTNTKVIVGLRFLSHQIWTPLLKEAKARQLTVFNAEGTGEAKKFIDQLLGKTNGHALEVASPVAPAVVIPPRPEPPGHTQFLTRWVWQKIEPSRLKTSGLNATGQERKRIGGTAEEARRLLEVATREGIAGNGGVTLTVEMLYGSVNRVIEAMGIAVGQPLPAWVTEISPETRRTIELLERSQHGPLPTEKAIDQAAIQIDGMRKTLQDVVTNAHLMIEELGAIELRLANAITLEDRVAKAEQVRIEMTRLTQVLEA